MHKGKQTGRKEPRSRCLSAVNARARFTGLHRSALQPTLPAIMAEKRWLGTERYGCVRRGTEAGARKNKRGARNPRSNWSALRQKKLVCGSPAGLLPLTVHDRAKKHAGCFTRVRFDGFREWVTISLRGRSAIPWDTAHPKGRDKALDLRDIPSIIR